MIKTLSISCLGSIFSMHYIRFAYRNLMHHLFETMRRNWAICSLGALKLILHLLAIRQYGFHRDEFLYLVQGDHLMWGYLEVPPFIAILGKVATTIFGTDLGGIRLFPLMASMLTLFLIWRMVLLLGGDNNAILLAGIAYVINPAFLRSGLLFQPVVFNQLWWTLCAYLLIRLIKYERRWDWRWLGVAAGVGFLTKYSIVFFIGALLVAALFTDRRRWFRQKGLYVSLFVAALIALPNLWWQYDHNFPIVNHMAELRATQLVNVSVSGFLTSQLIMSFAGSIVWVGGLIYILKHRDMQEFRMFGYAFIILMCLLIAGSGKAYYSLGVYPVLFAFGGIAFSDWIMRNKPRSNLMIAGLIVGLNFWIIPYGLPLLQIDKMQKYGAFMADHLGLSGPLIWEDGVQRSLPQDYADMFGWEEMAQDASRVYHDLDQAVQSRTIIYGGGYSHTATLNFYRKKYDYPEVYSLSNSFLFWAPKNLDFDYQIEVDDSRQTSSAYFSSVQVLDSIENKYAREKGFIYFKSGPKMDLQSTWNNLIDRRRERFTRD